MRIEQAEVLKAEYWDGVCEELDVKIQSAVERLINCTPEEVAKLQERIRTLQEVKGIPLDVIERQSPTKKE